MRGRDGGPAQRPHQSVGRAARQAQVPGDEVPGDRANQGRDDDNEADLEGDDLGDGIRHLGLKKTTVITAPARLRTAEIRTAIRGDTARVDTDVAMALAVS